VATPAPDIAAAFDRALARDDLYFFTRYGFLQQRGTKWLRNWHHAKICAALERVYRGECKRLIINIPPRYSKTEIAVINFIAWSLGKCPDAEFIHASYSARLATQNSWRTKGLVQTEWYHAIFPDVMLCDDSKAKDEWRTTAGGVMYATGAGGTITGYGAGKMREGFGGAIIIDDPHKADEARSDVMRQNVIDWFQTTMESRTNSPDTPIIVIMQRLHERDLAGWLIDGGNGEEWESLVLPALTDDDTTALWPAKHDVAALLRMQEASPYTFAGQYGQRPAPLAGGIIKPDRIEVIEALPAGMQWVRAWDFGATEGGGDPTVGAKLGLTKEGRVIIADITRGQWGPEGVEAAMKNTAGRDGTSCRIRIPQDPGQAGKAQVASMVRLLSGYSVAAAPVSGDKITRAEPLAAQINVGNVSMLRADWNDALVSEMRMFPNGAHDDQVDACADAYAALHTGNTGLLDYYAALVAKKNAEKEATQHG
jgi:predicted phage terminase large subunit-like protein